MISTKYVYGLVTDAQKRYPLVKASEYPDQIYCVLEIHILTDNSDCDIIHRVDHTNRLEYAKLWALTCYEVDLENNIDSIVEVIR